MFARHVFLVLVLLQRICDGFVVVVGASAPIAADVFVLWVEVAAFGGVVIADDVDVVVVVGQDLLLLVGFFRLLGLIWFMGVPMPVRGQLLVVSSAEVLVAVLWCGM